MRDEKPYRIHSLELGPMENLVYLIEDVASKRAALVDPAWQISQMLDLAKQKGLTITDVLLTHAHHDHINGVEKVLHECDAEVHMMKAEIPYWPGEKVPMTAHHGGDQLQLGDTLIDFLHTPGHTQGSACFHMGDDLLTGDTMFVFGCGHCKLAGADPNMLFDTLRKLKTSLPTDTIIHPGHNYAEKTTSSLQEQIDGNPFLLIDDQADFVRYREVTHDKTRVYPYQPFAKGDIPL